MILIIYWVTPYQMQREWNKKWYMGRTERWGHGGQEISYTNRDTGRSSSSISLLMMWFWSWDLIISYGWLINGWIAR